MRSMDLTVDRQSSYELLAEQARRLAAVRHATLNTAKRLMALRAMGLGYDEPLADLEVLNMVEAREAEDLDMMLAAVGRLPWGLE